MALKTLTCKSSLWWSHNLVNKQLRKYNNNILISHLLITQEFVQSNKQSPSWQHNQSLVRWTNAPPQRTSDVIDVLLVFLHASHVLLEGHHFIRRLWGAVAQKVCQLLSVGGILVNTQLCQIKNNDTSVTYGIFFNWSLDHSYIEFTPSLYINIWGENTTHNNACIILVNIKYLLIVMT